MQRDSALPASRERVRSMQVWRIAPTTAAASVSLVLLLVVAFAALRLLDAQRGAAAEVQRSSLAATSLGTAEAAAYRLEATALRALREPQGEDAIASQTAAHELRAALDAAAGSGWEQARAFTLRDEAEQLTAAAERVHTLARAADRAGAARAFSEGLQPRLQRLALALAEDRRRAAAAALAAINLLAGGESAHLMLLAGALAAVLALLPGAVAWQRQRQARRRLLEGLDAALVRAGHYVHAFLASSQQYATGSAHQTAAIEEMATSTEDVSATARYVATSSEQAARLTGGSQGAVNETVAYMEQVQAKVAAAVARITALGEQSRRVGAIADLISDIAGKTHLLSVNAAIEAVTAGQHGQRFSVVAGQVKDLATETQEATAQVQNIVAEIRAATEALVAAAQEAAHVAEAGAVAAHRAGAAMGDVVQVVQTISGATQQQEAASQQMVHTMHDVVSVARQSAEVSRQAAAEAERLKETTDELVGLADRLEHL